MLFVKLFQKLLVTPAVLGLMTPLGSSASELNFADVSDYSSSEEIENIREFIITDDIAASTSNLNNLDPIANDFEAGAFSETTTMSGSASFTSGAIDGNVTSEALTTGYSYSIDFNTGFTGEDNLYVGIETGSNAGLFVTDNSVTGDDSLKIHSMYYSFPVGGWDLAVGPKLDNDDLMPTTISTYSDSFFMGGYALTDSNFWLYGYTGSGIAASKVFDNGFNVSASVIGTGASTNAGFLTDQGIDVMTLSVGYDSDNYGGGLVYVDGDDYCGMINTYVSNACSSLGITTASITTMGIGGYWTPNEGRTMFSATSNLIDIDVTGVAIDNIADFQIGIDHGIGKGVLSTSWKTLPLYKVVNSDLKQDTLGAYYEIYYAYPVNDSFDLKGGVAMADPNTASGDTLELYDWTSIGAEVTFKF